MANKPIITQYGRPASRIMADPHTPISYTHTAKQCDVAKVDGELVVERNGRAVIREGTPVKLIPAKDGSNGKEIAFANDGTAEGLVWQEYDVTYTDQRVAVAYEGRFLEDKMEIKISDEFKKALPNLIFLKLS